MSIYYINDILYNEEQINQITWDNFTLSIVNSHPKYLYKYFPNSTNDGKNHSVEAIENNTVFLQNPIKFDDPYDCNYCVNPSEFSYRFIKKLAMHCGLKVEASWDFAMISYQLALRIFNHIMSGNSLDSIISTDSSNELENLKDKLFINFLKLELTKSESNEKSYQNAINKTIDFEYKNSVRLIYDKIRISCFTQTPYSMLMWSHYANNHKGFCIEYKWSDDYKKYSDIINNIFPVIYTDSRKNLVDFFISLDEGNHKKEDLWNIYKYGLLSKSLDWKYQKEWRLLTYENAKNDYNYRFFDINKIYLGCKMEKEERSRVIGICNKLRIPWTCVVISDDQFKMKECVSKKCSFRDASTQKVDK